MAINMLDKITHKKIYRAYTDLFDSPVGSAVLKDLCEAHGVFDGGFDPDPCINAFSSGERNVVLRILTILNMNPNDIIDLANQK